MKISSFIPFFKTKLHDLYSENEKDQILFLIFEELLNYKRIDLTLKREEELPVEIYDKLISINQRLIAGEPIQYILGYSWFAGLKLKVNPAVLIPRQETEELVDWIVKENVSVSPTIIDICSGSGCIGLALKKQIPHASITGIDISSSANSVAKENAQLQNLDVTFLEQDILNNKLSFSDVDVIVSNPPYVQKSEAHFMKANVLDHEPHLALFVPEDEPLLFYQRVAMVAKQSLKKGGKLYLEINENLSKETAEILEQQGFHDISIRKDLNNKFRMIRSIK